MKQFVFGVLFSLAAVSVAVTPHQDGSVTFERDEMDAIRLQFMSMKNSLQNCGLYVEKQREEIEHLRQENDKYLKNTT